MYNFVITTSLELVFFYKARMIFEIGFLYSPDAISECCNNINQNYNIN